MPFSPASIDRLKADFEGKHGIHNIQEGAGVRFTMRPSGSVGDDEALQFIRKFKEKLSADLQSALITVLKDNAAMQTILRSIELYRGLVLHVIFEDDLARIDDLRGQTELPEDRERLVSLVKQTLVVLGHTDLDVEILSTRDALLRSCQGLYTPEVPGKSRAKIAIPL